MENREAIVRKLNALKARFEHGATSEPEALAAMNKYHELMQRYNLTETDLNIRESGVKAGHFHSETYNGSKNTPTIGWLIFPIGKATETRGILMPDNSALFIGTQPDVEYAEFLFRLLDRAIPRAWGDFKHGNPLYKEAKEAGHHGRAIRNAFEKGFLQRMTHKLMEMAPKNEGKGLIVLKNQLIEAAMEQAGMKTTGAKQVQHRANSRAVAMEGGKSADKVILRQQAEQQKYLEAK